MAKKKTRQALAILLSVFLLGSLAACGDMVPIDAPTAGPTAPPVTDPPTDPPPTEPPTDPTEAPTTAPTEWDVTFEDVQETIYTTDVLNVRTGPGTEYEWIGQLNIGESVQRTGIGSNGWSRITYMGATAYVHSDYVTTEAPEEPEATFEDVEETVYTTNVLNVRAGPGTRCEWLGQLSVGESVLRTGIGSNGWSRIIYNGETAYVHGYYVSTKSGIERLEGSWISVYRMEVEDGRDFLVTREYVFNSDGTGHILVHEYIYDPELTEEDGWSPAGMGNAEDEFTYDLMGDELEIHYPGGANEWGEYDEPHTRTYAVYQLDETWLVLSDNDFGSYIRNNDVSLEELCETLDVDYRLPDGTE